MHLLLLQRASQDASREPRPPQPCNDDIMNAPGLPVLCGRHKGATHGREGPYENELLAGLPPEYHED